MTDHEHATRGSDFVVLSLQSLLSFFILQPTLKEIESKSQI